MENPHPKQPPIVRKKRSSSFFLGASIPGEYTEVLQYHHRHHHDHDIEEETTITSTSDSEDFDNNNNNNNNNTPLLLKPQDVLIEVYYSDINPVDLQKLRNFKKVPSPPKSNNNNNDDDDDVDDTMNSNKPYYFIPGYGGSGIVTKVGSDVANNNNNIIIYNEFDDDMQGKRVCFICDPSRQQQGSYSSHVVVDSRNVAILPDNISTRDAASIPVAGLTAYESLLKLGILLKTNNNNNNQNKTKQQQQQQQQQQEAETTTATKTNKKRKKSLLIVGGSGGVGSWAIILARAAYSTSNDLNIIVTCTTPQQQEWCLSIGANETIQHDDIDTPTSKLGGSRDGCVDYILCLTEPKPEVFTKLSNVIKVYGQICFVVAGKSINSIDLSFCFFKCVSIHCQTVFSSIRTNFQHVVPSEELNAILELLTSSTQKKVNTPISPDILTNKVSIQFKDALKPNCGVLHALASCKGRRGKFVLQIKQQQDEEEGADNK